MTRRDFSLTQTSSGFTLLEVMIAMAVLATTLVAVFNLQSVSLSLACEARFNTTGPLLAQKKMAELEVLDPEDLFSNSGKFEDYPGYNWEFNVVEPDFGIAEDVSDYLRQINLTISYGEDELYSYTLRMYKFIAK